MLNESDLSTMEGLGRNGFRKLVNLKERVDRVIGEIRDLTGVEPEVRLGVETSKGRSQFYKISFKVVDFAQPILVRKKGRKPMSVLGRVRRVLLRKIRHLQRTQLGQSSTPLTIGGAIDRQFHRRNLQRS